MVDGFGINSFIVYILLCHKKSVEEIMYETKMGEGQIGKILNFIEEKKIPTYNEYVELETELEKFSSEIAKFKNFILVKKGDQLGVEANGKRLYTKTKDKMVAELAVSAKYGESGLKNLMLLKAGEYGKKEEELKIIIEIVDFLVDGVEDFIKEEQISSLSRELESLGVGKKEYEWSAPFSLGQASESVRKRDLPASDILIFQGGMVLFLVLLFVFIYLFFGQKPGQINMHTLSYLEFQTDKPKYVEGEDIMIIGDAVNCGTLIIVMANELEIKEFEGGNSSFQSNISLSAGSYTLTASSGECQFKNKILVEKRECKKDESKECFYEGCAGEMLCMGGRWSSCISRRECTPADQIACPLPDGCSWGIKACDKCGKWSGCIK